jgi:phage terminase small subunit
MAQKTPARAKEKPSHKEMREMFMENLCQGMKVYPAAIKAGYAESWAKSNAYKVTKTPVFQQEIRNYFLRHNALMIPRVLNSYKRAIEHIDGKQGDELVKDLTSAKHLHKQALQIAQILAPEQTHVQQINIKELQVLMADPKNHPKRITGEAIDVEEER